MRDFDDNEFPLAYLITLRTYGTWLHGDERRSMDRKHNVYGTLKTVRNPRLQESDAKQLKHPPVTLNTSQRSWVEKAVQEVCDHRHYVLRAINVRTNHVHHRSDRHDQTRASARCLQGVFDAEATLSESLVDKY